MTTNAFNPMIPLLQGQQFEQGLSQAELEGIALRERLAGRKAAAEFGSGNYFAGMEGIPGAERSNAIKAAYASGDIELAIKLEALASENAKLERGIGIAGRTEAAKKDADYLAQTNAYARIREMQKGPMNALSKRLTGEQAPSSPNVGEPSAVQDVEGASGQKEYAEFGPQGLKFGMENMPEITRQQGIAEIIRKREETDIEKKNFQQKAEQDITANIRDLNNQIADQEAKLPLRQANPAFLRQLYQRRTQQEKALDDLVKGKIPSVPPSASAVPIPVPAPEKGPGLAPTVPASANAPPVAPSASQGLKLNEYEEAALKRKAIEHDTAEKISAANKEIVTARLGAQKNLKTIQLQRELHDLVMKHNVGHPELKDIVGAETALSINRTNAQVANLNNAITASLVESGQAQIFNTIVEMRLQGAKLPGLFVEPQQNKINSAITLSTTEQLQKYPGFLERWSKAHGRTLDGSEDAWIDYAVHNPYYTYKKDARGTVTVTEEKNVIEPETWLYLRQNKMIRSIGDKTYIKQNDGAWKEK